jgi:hypothetical protein
MFRSLFIQFRVLNVVRSSCRPILTCGLRATPGPRPFVTRFAKLFDNLLLVTKSSYIYPVSSKRFKRILKFRVFCDVAPYSHVKVDRRFRGAYCFHHQGDEELRTALFMAPMMEAVLASESRSTSTWLHGATSQKTLNFGLKINRDYHLVVAVCTSATQPFDLKTLP